MTHAFVTIICPLALERVPDAENEIDALRNPADQRLAGALDIVDPNGFGTHFISMHAVRSPDGENAYLLCEFSGDGTVDEATKRVVDAIGSDARRVFMLATDWKDGTDLLPYLREHTIAPGTGWFDDPGLVFTGTPGMTVGRIRAEAGLAAHIMTLLGQQKGDMHALARVNDVRDQLRRGGAFQEMLAPAEAEAPHSEPSSLPLGAVALAGLQKYLWPLGLVILASGAIAGFCKAARAADGWPWFWAFARGAGSGVLAATLISIVVIAAIAAIGYALLLRAEANDSVDERVVGDAVNAAMFERENHLAQNHMISVTRRKPGILRSLILRLVFFAIGELAGRAYRPGFLSGIGTIHFARWITPPGSRDLVFLSNYGGSWESYLEDFITLAHDGLTAVWSNSVGFPRTESLIEKGASDGERFKRFARHSMIPTRFWYSGYQATTTAQIRTHAAIRRGLSGALTEDEAIAWLALFGSAGRPASKLMSNDIQSLVFGGLSFMPSGTCLIFDDLPGTVPAARQWLRHVAPHIAFNDGRLLVGDAVVTFAVGARGLARLGLPANAVETFPFAYRDGMTSPARSQILGDSGTNAPGSWAWGKTAPDVALLVYGKTDAAVARLVGVLTRAAQASGMNPPYAIPLKALPDPKDKNPNKTEPFGFVDGISQPVIRGTYKGLRAPDPVHLVEPGEFILGYPDNRNNIPPGPNLSAIADPENLLPLCERHDDFSQNVVTVDRDLGFNGTFLVIRQLEQDVNGFRTYCESEATRLASRLPPPYAVTSEFIGAKLVGRWKDGSSLARFPYESHTALQPDYGDQTTIRALSTPTGGATPVTPPAVPAKAPPQASAAPATQAPVAPPRPDNDFLFGSEDPEALRCPFGAHIRRANPRDSFNPGSAEQISISNRHRIIRVGRQYEPQRGQNPGLFFMCLNGDIERQFEFLQQTWLRSPSFHGLSCEKDPLLGDGQTGVCNFTIPSRDGPVRLNPMPQFVTTKGGGYFFMPGRRLIDYLGA